MSFHGYLYLAGFIFVLGLALYWRTKHYAALEAEELAEAQAKKARELSDQFRSFLARSTSPCIYCGLSADKWATCPSGFPGCGRMDDATAFYMPERIVASPAWVERVEELTGMGCGAWDCVDPVDIIQAVLDVARLRQTSQAEVLDSLLAWGERPGATEEELDRIMEAAVKAGMGYDMVKRAEAVKCYKQAKGLEDEEGKELW